MEGPAASGIPGGSSGIQLKDCTRSSYEDDDDESQDEDSPPVAINKSKQSSFKWELAGLDGNLGSALEAPAHVHQRRSRTDHCRCRSGWLTIGRAEGNYQSRMTLCCESDVISEMECWVFLFLGRIIASEKLWAWLIDWEELGTDYVCFLYSLDLQLWYCPRGVQCGFWVRSLHGIGLGWSGGAAVSILVVYVSNGWIDNSIYASPIWQLHHKLTYASLCARIGPIDCSYLNSQFIKLSSKMRSSWCGSSGYECQLILERGNCQNWLWIG